MAQRLLRIAESFLWMEGVLILAAFAQRWRLRLLPGPPVEPVPLVTLRPHRSLRMTVDPRPHPATP
jgi:cytochrome P450